MFLPQGTKFIKACNLSADGLHHHILVQNWIHKLYNKNKMQKHIKSGAGFYNSAFQYQAKHKKNL
jgi:hypothetical protein